MQQVQLLQEENMRLKDENARILAHNQNGKAKLELLEQQMHEDRQSYEEALIRLQHEADHIREKQSELTREPRPDFHPSDQIDF